MSLVFSPRGALASLMLCSCFNPQGHEPLTGGSSTGENPPPVTSSSEAGTGSPETAPTETAPPGTTADLGSTSGEPSTGPDETTNSVDETTAEPGGCAAAPSPDGYCLELNARLPYCEMNSSTCVVCLDDLDCPAMTVCDPDSFTCVACVDDNDCNDPGQPACDPDTHVCGCDEHAQCPQTACDLEAHACFPPSQTAVVWSSSSFGSQCLDDMTDCSEMAPCCNLSDAFSRAISTEQDYIVIRVLPGQPGLHDTLIINDLAVNKRVAVLGWPEATLESHSGTGPHIFVNAATRVFVARLTLQALDLSMAGAGISCFGGLGAWVDDVTVDPLPAGVGLFASACPLQARRTVVRGARGGIWLAGGAAGKFINTIVAHPIEYGVRTEQDADATLVFSTVVERTGVEGSLLRCSDPGSSVVARNSLLFSVPESAVSGCPGSLASNSIVTLDSLAGPGATTITDSEVANLFIAFDAGNLHVKPGSPLLSSAAIREPGDPQTDIDGDPRPLEVNAQDWAGADVP